jgi:hypothetical protein
MADYGMLIEAGAAIGVFGYFRYWMGREMKDIKDKLEIAVPEKLCNERRTKCSDEKCRKIVQNRDDIKENIHSTFHHGHKGLPEDGNAVFSTD